MSDGNRAIGAGQPQEASSGGTGSLATAGREAEGLKDAASHAAHDVVGTAKGEAASVGRETKVQITDLFHQTRNELSDQASKQQERIAQGLSALGDELGAMARSSDSSGIASDLVEKASGRVTEAGNWLASRDPSTLVSEVKAFARRRPGVFIGGAVLAGIAVGRLTRALAANAKESTSHGSSTDANAAPAPTLTSVGALAPVGMPPATADESPVFEESAARQRNSGQGVPGERADAF